MMLFVNSNRMVYWTGQAEGMRAEGLGGGGVVVVVVVVVVGLAGTPTSTSQLT